MMKLLVVPSISPTFYLTEEDSKHLIKVLRMSEGAEVHVTIGDGNLHRCVIAAAHPKKTQLKLIDTINSFGQHHYALHIAICPTKNNDRLEWFLEKATEIGIDKISILIGEHSERQIFKIDRYEKIILSAVKQSLKAYIPKIEIGGKVLDFLAKNHSEDLKLIAHCNTSFERQLINKQLLPEKKYLILIGPEGDFSPKEIQMAYLKGFKGTQLSHNRLRTETAAVSITDYIAYLNLG